ncbi:hypothetical protein THRCLA_09073, partial [Thraustotheca clavata]
SHANLTWKTMNSSSTPTTCYFHGCTSKPLEGTVKCHFHRNRGLCRVPHCRNQVYARSLCVRHGGRHPCAHPGCSTNARLGDFCCRHSRFKKLCHYPGCTKVIQINNRCIRHGGSKNCQYPGCTTPARAAGHCWRHRKHIKRDHSEASENQMKMDDIGSSMQKFMLDDSILKQVLDATENSNETFNCSSPEDLDASILDVLLTTPFQEPWTNGETLGRSKFCRFLQYVAKTLRISLTDKEPQTLHGHFQHEKLQDELYYIKWCHTIEAITSASRKANRLFRFLDMYLLFHKVQDRDLTIRRLRQLRVLTFFFMFLFENLSLFLPKVKRVKVFKQNITIHLSRWCHSAWFVSIILGMTLDHRLKRGSSLSTLKNLLELPIAFILSLRLRVSDPFMCSLGLSSSFLTLLLHAQRRTKALACEKLVE